MKTLVLYDSLHGNTKKIAEAIYEGIKNKGNSKCISVEDITLEDLKDLDLLIVGSPTHGGTAKPTLLEFLKKIPTDYLKDINVGTFDTRFLEKDLKWALRLLVKTIGYAAPKISKILEDKGAKSVIESEGFIVKETEGPIADGEIERARDWGNKIYSKIS